MNSTFNAIGFLRDNFRSPAQLIALVQAYGFTPPRHNTVEKWFQREAIPTQWGFFILGLLEIDRGSPISVVAYLGGGTNVTGA